MQRIDTRLMMRYTRTSKTTKIIRLPAKKAHRASSRITVRVLLKCFAKIAKAYIRLSFQIVNLFSFAGYLVPHLLGVLLCLNQRRL